MTKKGFKSILVKEGTHKVLNDLAEKKSEIEGKSISIGTIVEDILKNYLDIKGSSI